MNVLLVEDREARIEWFKKHINDCGMETEIYSAVDAEAAVDLLDHEKFDIMFLDHDLGTVELMDINDEKSGSVVAKHMAENHPSPRACVIIHSQNPAGSQYMYQTLRAAGYEVIVQPFTTLYHHVQKGNKLIVRVEAKR
jgi:CheY-like chemotaxis protein